ncbi:hypothetical protein LZU11_01675 [Staphylococcus epidermidis]|nr:MULTISPECIES: hypothetical protein [Staphylococcus]ECO2926552.1 hypothetical protein [Campylobacter jejuni]MBT2892179.1 hypothetical protein [Streptomyces sp. McG2]MBM5939397.1 hypothetical protein [Staphylococcus epidermidis]MBM5946129.1 hypothetical protein [Staphylococcus epidermidis]MBM5952926.1 hypothetical protein [Staphylococcus epidermidis]
MRKLVFLISTLVIILAACSSSPTKNAQGKWKNEDGIIFTIKDDSIKVTDEGLSMEGSIEDDDNHKGLAKINLDGDEGYIKIKGNSLYALNNPNSKPTKEDKFKKID